MTIEMSFMIKDQLIRVNRGWIPKLTKMVTVLSLQTRSLISKVEVQ